MKYVKLGSSDIEVSRCCLGTMTWGKQNTEEEGHAQMDYALTQGVNFWDTAEMYAVPPSAETYGKTEEIIGTWLAKNPNKRKGIVLASKIVGPGHPWVREGKAKIDSVNIKVAVEDSLKRLQTDYTDLYQLHWPNRPKPHFHTGRAGELDFTKVNTEREEENFLDVLQALDELMKGGKIRAIGLSDDSAWGIAKYTELAKKHNLPRMVSIQNEFSLLCRRDDPHLAETCVRESVAYLPWSPLGGGMISGKYMGGARPAGTRWSIDNRPIFRDTDDAHAAVQAYIDVAKKHGLDVCQMAIKWCDKQNFVTSTIIGATSLAQLKTDIAAFDLEISNDVMDDIQAVYHKYPMTF